MSTEKTSVLKRKYFVGPILLYNTVQYIQYINSVSLGTDGKSGKKMAESSI